MSEPPAPGAHRVRRQGRTCVVSESLSASVVYIHVCFQGTHTHRRRHHHPPFLLSEACRVSWEGMWGFSIMSVSEEVRSLVRRSPIPDPSNHLSHLASPLQASGNRGSCSAITVPASSVLVSRPAPVRADSPGLLPRLPLGILGLFAQKCTGFWFYSHHLEFSPSPPSRPVTGSQPLPDLRVNPSLQETLPAWTTRVTPSAPPFIRQCPPPPPPHPSAPTLIFPARSTWGPIATPHDCRFTSSCGPRFGPA